MACFIALTEKGEKTMVENFSNAYSRHTMTKEALLAIPQRHWSEVLFGVTGVYVLPSDRESEYENGFAYLDMVAEWPLEADKPMVRFGSVCEDVMLYGFGFRMDCLYPSGIIHIWNRNNPFEISMDGTSISFRERGGHEE